jgi:pyruvate dehydrogenase E2 component (dihydrolipoamide acetyltransferase)
MSQDPAPFGDRLPPWPQVDFAAFGPVESHPLSRVQKLVSGYMARNWTMIPHVTHHDEADISGLEVALAAVKAAHTDVRITPLAFFLKAAVAALKQYPRLNASLDVTGGTLILKKYFHIGFAVDTPGGLLVPVIRDCDQKALAVIAGEIAVLSQKAREKGLPMNDMVGGCFTISSLGGIGGTAFTPIINAPEVAILGITKAQWKPRRLPDGGLEWRLMLPLSLSYDHRVINGADAARFTVAIAGALAEPSALADLEPA